MPLTEPMNTCAGTGLESCRHGLVVYHLDVGELELDAATAGNYQRESMVGSTEATFFSCREGLVELSSVIRTPESLSRTRSW
jgi:hypothetical protein